MNDNAIGSRVPAVQLEFHNVAALKLLIIRRNVKSDLLPGLGSNQTASVGGTEPNYVASHRVLPACLPSFALNVPSALN